MMMQHQQNNHRMSITNAIILLLVGSSIGIISSIDALVVFDSRSVLISNINGTISQIEMRDTTFDNVVDVVAVGTSNLVLSLQRDAKKKQSFTPVEYGDLLGSNNGASTRTIESVDYFTKFGTSSTDGSIVIAVSRPSGGSSSGAIQLIRQKSTKAGTLSGTSTLQTLVPSKNYKGSTTTIKQVNGCAVRVIDIDNDNYPDIIATIYGKTSSSTDVGFLLLIKDTAKNNFVSGSKITILAEDLGGKARFDIGDSDKNGLNDIAVLGVDSQILTVFYQETNHTFTPKVIDTNATSNLAISVAPFNGGTDADIFTVGATGVTGYLATKYAGDQGYRGFFKNIVYLFNPKTFETTNYRSFQIRLHDVDQDGLVDIVLVFGHLHGIRWMKQLPQSRLTGPNNLVTPIIGAPDAFDIRDINKDGIDDFVIHSTYDNSIYLALGRNQ